jgi:hypothetical protein
MSLLKQPCVLYLTTPIRRNFFTSGKPSSTEVCLNLAAQRSGLNLQFHRVEHIVAIEKLDEFATSASEAHISRARSPAVRYLHKTHYRGVSLDKCRNDLRGIIGGAVVYDYNLDRAICLR